MTQGSLSPAAKRKLRHTSTYPSPARPSRYIATRSPTRFDYDELTAALLHRRTRARPRVATRLLRWTTRTSVRAASPTPHLYLCMSAELGDKGDIRATAGFTKRRRHRTEER